MNDLVTALERLKKRIDEAIDSYTEHPCYEEIADNSIDANLIKNGTIGDEIVVKVPDINVGDLISRQLAIKDIYDLPNCPNGYSDTYDKACIVGVLEEQPTVDAVPIVRCKDCKHRPIDTGGHNYGQDLDFPSDFKCPCRCDDPWYSWMPKDDWFCANGERKEE